MSNTQWAKKQYEEIRDYLYENKDKYGLAKDEKFTVMADKGKFHLGIVSYLPNKGSGHIATFDTEDFLNFIRCHSILAIQDIYHNKMFIKKR